MSLKITDLSKYNHIHLIGIGGISMSAIAETLKNWNYTVTGSDLNASDITDNLISNGIDVVIGHDLINSKKADLIIYSAAISDEDPEMLIAKKNDIPLIDRGSFVGFLTKLYKETICISGTHGKTTTTSMISICFVNAGKDPSIEVGALLKEINGNYRIGNSEYFVLESCEYKGNFLKFHPKTEVILNIDNDHLDYFKTFDNIVTAFKQFATLVNKDGLIVTNADDPNCIELKKYVNCNFITYGINNKDATFHAENIQFDENGFPSFDVYKNNEYYEHLELSVAGIHNVLNALACTAVCDSYDIPSDVVKSSLKTFTGANRRLEFKGKLNDVVSIFDDYAHHPTEIKATSNALKNKVYNESWVVFQPHTFSRTKLLLDDFADSIIDFDNIIITDIYAARESDTYGISSKDLVNKLEEKGKSALYISDFNQIVNYLKENVKANDLILTLGAGTVTNIGPMLLK